MSSIQIVNCPAFRANSKPFNDGTCFNHLKAGLFRYLDAYFKKHLNKELFHYPLIIQIMTRSGHDLKNQCTSIPIPNFFVAGSASGVWWCAVRAIPLQGWVRTTPAASSWTWTSHEQSRLWHWRQCSKSRYVKTPKTDKVGIWLPAIRLPETSSYRTFSSPLTEWSNNP